MANKEQEPDIQSQQDVASESPGVSVQPQVMQSQAGKEGYGERMRRRFAERKKRKSVARKKR
jgi:hypothetical protein